MRIYFFTENLDQKLYKRAIEVFLYETLKKADNRWVKILDNLVINIFSSTKSSNDPNFHGENGVGGVTGMNRITLYLLDEKTNPRDSFQMAFRSNMIATSHELCHHILISMGYNNRVALRNDDYSGHKKGQLLNFSTAEVHDRHMEKRFQSVTFWNWLKGIIPYRITMQYLDIRDVL